MTLLAFLLGFIVSPLVTLIIYLDTSRRHLSQRKRLLWTGNAGVISFLGFLLPHLFTDLVHRVYLLGIKPMPVVHSPLELLLVHITVGITISVLSLIFSGLGSRYAPSVPD